MKIFLIILFLCIVCCIIVVVEEHIKENKSMKIIKENNRKSLLNVLSYGIQSNFEKENKD